MARIILRLEIIPPRHRRPCCSDHDPHSVSDPPPTGCGRRKCRSVCRWRTAIRDVLGAGGAVTAVHDSCPDELFLLRHAFRPDLSYGELRGELRHPDDCRCFDLQRGRAGRHGRTYRLWYLRGSLRSQECSRHRAAASGIRRAGLCLRARSRQLLRGGGVVWLHLCRCHAALLRSCA